MRIVSPPGSGDWVVVGIHNDPIGVDIEEVKNVNIYEINKSTFSSKEFRYLITSPKLKKLKFVDAERKLVIVYRLSFFGFPKYFLNHE